MPMPTTPFRSALAAVLLALVSWPAAAQHVLNGRIQLFNERGQALRTTDVEDVVVYYQPSTEGAEIELEPPAEPLSMVTRNKEFEPGLLVIPRGGTVRFPNEDPILHNVFSVSPGNRFDVGLYRRGEGKSHTFDEAGLVRVFCNVHYAMSAHILVLDTPFYTRPSVDGRFRLEDLPAGPGRLTVWQERAQPVTVDIQLPREGTLVLRLDLSRRRVPEHLNKFGKPYSRRDRYN